MTNNNRSVRAVRAQASGLISLHAGAVRRASDRTASRGLALAVLVAAIMAGCTSPRPAPIVRREPARPSIPLVREPPMAAVPGSPDVGPTGELVQTTPVRPSAGEARPLPSAAQPIAPAVPGVPGSVVRTEPNASKRPYSDALLAQMKSSASPVAPVAAAPATVVAEKPSSSGFIWPAAGQVIEGFSAPKSTGIAIAGKPGDPVVAAASGKVIFSGQGPRPYGNLVIIKHEGDTLSVYAHNRALLVKEGASVKRGQLIAELGESGTNSPQLHFEIRKEGKPVDPSQFLPAR